MRAIHLKSFGHPSVDAKMGKTWFAVEAKTFEISIEEKNNKSRGCIWERCKGVTSWVRFRESSL